MRSLVTNSAIMGATDGNCCANICAPASICCIACMTEERPPLSADGGVAAGVMRVAFVTSEGRGGSDAGITCRDTLSCRMPFCRPCGPWCGVRDYRLASLCPWISSYLFASRPPCPPRPSCQTWPCHPFLARIVANAFASEACRLRVGLLEWDSLRANAPVDMPARLALALKAPGCFITSPRGFPNNVPLLAIG